MGVLERKQREKELRRKEILCNAKAIITEKGLDAMTMQAVAEKVELSKATIYTYFKNREEILFEIRKEAAQAFFDYAKPSLDENLTGIELLRRLWQSYLSFFGESNDIFICIGVQSNVTLGLRLDDFVENHNSDDPMITMMDILESILQKGIKDGTIIDSINPKKITKLLLLITTTVVQDVTKMPENMRNSNRIASELQKIFELILRGLASDSVSKNTLILSTDLC